MQKKRKFIGGTGRSGTPVLSELLGSRQLVNKIPFESRFIVDNVVLISLYDGITGKYSVEKYVITPLQRRVLKPVVYLIAIAGCTNE